MATFSDSADRPETSYKYKESAMMDIGEVLSSAWRIIWKHKVLWIFGLLAGCASGGGNGGGQGAGSVSNSPEFPGLERYFYNISDWQVALLIGVIIFVVLLIVLLVVVLSTVGRIGLVRGTMMADEGVVSLSFGELFRGSAPYFWRVLGLNLLVALVILLVVTMLVIFMALAGIVTFGIALLCLLPFICVLVPLGWFVGIIIEQANVALVADNVGIMEALRRGWDVTKNNLGSVIVMGLILILGGGLIGFMLAAPFVLIITPLVVALSFGSNANLGVSIALICGILYLPVLLALGGALQAYIGSAWTLTYLRLTGRRPGTIEVAPEPVVESE
jgi:hypothetical protein